MPLHVCLSVRLSVGEPVVRLSLSGCLSTRVSVCLFVFSVRLFVYLLYLGQTVCPSAFQSFGLSVCL